MRGAILTDEGVSGVAGRVRGTLLLAALVTVLVTALTAFESAASEPSVPAAASPVEVRLSAEGRFDAGSSVTDAPTRRTGTGEGTASGPRVRFTVTNRTSAPLSVLVRGTPLDPFPANAPFEVRGAARGWPAIAPLPWVGPIARRLPPGPADVRALAPGASTSALVAIADGYAVPAAGTYRVSWNGTLAVSTDGGPFAPVRAGTAAVELRLPVAYAPNATRLRPATYRGCSTVERAGIVEAATIAERWTAEARMGLEALDPDDRPLSPRYRLWFGAHEAARFSTVVESLRGIEGALEEERIGYVCGCTEPGVFAYVNPLRAFEITLCPVFWQTSTDGRDSRAGTLVHELSHFRALAGTQDHAYAQGPSQRLALASPALAVRNADSYGYFTENRPAVAIDPADALPGDDDPGGVGAAAFASLVPGETVRDELELGTRAFYRVVGASSLVLESLSGDADLVVYADPALASLRCRSERVEPVDECALPSDVMSWVEVYAYSTASYRLSAVAGTDAPSAPGVADTSAAATSAGAPSAGAPFPGGPSGTQAVDGTVPVLGTLEAGDSISGTIGRAEIVAWRLIGGALVELESLDGDADLYLHSVPPAGEPLGEATLVCQSHGDSAAGETLERCLAPAGTGHYVLVAGFREAGFTLAARPASGIGPAPDVASTSDAAADGGAVAGGAGGAGAGGEPPATPGLLVTDGTVDASGARPGGGGAPGWPLLLGAAAALAARGRRSRVEPVGVGQSRAMATP